MCVCPCAEHFKGTENTKWVHATCGILFGDLQTLKPITARELIKLVKLTKTEANAPGHYKQGLSGHILENVSSETNKRLSPEQKQ